MRKYCQKPQISCKTIAKHLFPPDSYNEVSRYGEIESFFFGLQLHELIDVFKEQKIEFKQLLLLSEADLIHLGKGRGMKPKTGWGKGRRFDGLSKHFRVCDLFY